MILINSYGKANYTKQGSNQYLLNYPCSDNNCYPYIITLKPGKYLLECWGASGSSTKEEFVRGAYVSGVLNIKETLSLYAYIGNVGKLNGEATFNGGGKGSKQGYSGGGATDFRLFPGDTFSSITSLLSRIIIAGGGAGLNVYSDDDAKLDEICDYGQGGSEEGGCGYFRRCTTHTSVITHAYGGNQKEAGLSGHCESPCMHGYKDHNLRGKLGVGVDTQNAAYSTGGGGGYFGGGAGAVDSGVVSSGGGGSSYVSGHPNCSSLTPNYENSIGYDVDIEKHIHYSGIEFKNPIMIDGRNEIIEPDGTIEKGHTGSGQARITILNQFHKITCKKKFRILLFLPFVYVFILKA